MRWQAWWPWSKRVPVMQVTSGDEWITVPFRFAEAARLSVYTIAQETGIPVGLRQWIAQWLESYNSQLIMHMRENYGPNIFPILDEITRSVMPDGAMNAGNSPVNSAEGDHEMWSAWEQELGGEHRE